MPSNGYRACHLKAVCPPLNPVKGIGDRPVKRDVNLIRALLLEIEGGKTVFETYSSEEAAILPGLSQETRTKEAPTS
jgi:hypothetical protein